MERCCMSNDERAGEAARRWSQARRALRDAEKGLEALESRLEAMARHFAPGASDRKRRVALGEMVTQCDFSSQMTHGVVRFKTRGGAADVLRWVDLDELAAAAVTLQQARQEERDAQKRATSFGVDL